MSEMVERVARALCRYLKLEPDDAVRIVSDRGEARMGCRWEDFAAMGRVAIEAMRVPTEAMWDAANPRGRVLRENEKWQAMCDEALK